MTEDFNAISRRTVLGGLAAVGAAGPVFAASPPLPTSPVVISVMSAPTTICIEPSSR